MKKITKVISIALVLVMALAVLTSCSKYPALKKAFEAKEYTENTTFTGLAETIKEQLGKEEYAVEMHLLTKSNGITSVLIVEFKSTEDLAKFYNESNTVQGLVKDISTNEDLKKVYEALENAGYVKGNCFCIPLSVLYVNEITTIVKEA